MRFICQRPASLDQRRCAGVSTELWCSGRLLGENLTKVRELIPHAMPVLTGKRYRSLPFSA